MRFSIRDLLWATVVVALGLGWWMDHHALNAKLHGSVDQARRFKATLKEASTSNHGLYIDWSIQSSLDEPLVEP